MHPEDRNYFKAFANDAARAGLSLQDHYLAIQDGHSGSLSTILPSQIPALRFAHGYIRDSDTCLIVGCGAGTEIRWLQGQGCRNITGLDINEDLLAKCREDYGVETVQSDMRDSGLADRAYDVVLTRQSLHHLFYPFAALEELARIARRRVVLISEPIQSRIKGLIRRMRGGRTISAAHIYEYQFDPQDVHRYMAFNGFELAAYWRYLESIGLPPVVNRALGVMPAFANRFTAVYERMSDIPTRPV